MRKKVLEAVRFTHPTIATIALVVACSHVAAAATLEPVDVERFFVTPDHPAVLQWHVESGRLAGPIEAIARDYGDRAVATIPAKITADGLVELTVKLPVGFYEIELPAVGQRFGLVALAPVDGPRDPFFSIDAAMSWLVRGDDRVREGLVKVLQRSGVVMSRERLNWAQINPNEGEWDWDSPLHYETLRKTYAAHGVEVLEMFHGTTRWAGVIERYPDDLVGTARAWREIGRRWRPAWGAMEVWNEPDISFGGNLPADQYVPLVRTIACAFDQAGVDVPLVGGVFAHYLPPYLDGAARNGLLDLVDVASFHTYGRAPGMEDLIGKYRAWLAAHDRPAMPLWLTECGRPWKRGPDRPPADQDAASALDVTMKAVESRACGVARYFAFVYPFYEERDNNFGLMGRRATPLRSMAAYARLASLLANKPYLGDLRCDDRAVQRARVFGDERQTIAVVYTGAANEEARVALGVPALGIEGIDGRPLEAADDGAVPVPDGLVYVRLDRTRLGDRLRADTPAMPLWSIGQQDPPRPTRPSPIVLRYQFDRDLVEAKSDGYRLKQETPGKMPLVFRVFNLSPKPRQLRVELSFSRPSVRVIGAAVQPASVSAEGSVDVAWQVDLAGAFAVSEPLGVKVRALDEASEPVVGLEIDVSP